jgi:hypothetical protein
MQQATIKDHCKKEIIAEDPVYHGFPFIGIQATTVDLGSDC